MFDGDLFVQYIDVPDDRPALPPVDEDICGLEDLKDFSSLETPTDLHINRGYNEPSGLLLGSDLCHNFRQGVDTFDAIALPYGTPPDARQNAFLPTSDLSPSHVPSYVNLFPPALSPDASPTSVASSTPWLRTPETDPSLANVANMDDLWDAAKVLAEEPCSTQAINFLDQAGNNLEDIPSQVQDVMLEDIACTPQIISDTSLPRVFNATPCGSLGPVTPTPPSNTPIFVISPPPCASASPTEAVPPGSAHCTSLPPSPHMVQSLFAFSPMTCHPRETPLPGYSASPSLSPLSTLSFFSQSPSASPNSSPLIGCSSLSPAISPVPLSNSDEGVEVTDSVSSTLTGVTSVKLRGKRGAGTLDDDAPPWKIPRRSKAKNVDEEEWNPGFARVRRPRAVASSKSTRQTAASIPDCPPSESSNCETGQGSGGQSDAAHTSCEICGQGFTRTSDYIRHIENSTSHPETRKVWPCSFCDSTLGRKDALVRHIRTMHPGKPVVIPEGIPGSQLPEGQKEPSVQRIGQRKMPFTKQPRKDTRRYPGR